MVDLAICVTAYNRPECLCDLLDTILAQLTDENSKRIEICISDDCSPRSFQMVLDKMKDSKAAFHYHRNSKNLRLDLNICKVIQLCEARYCWLIGDDDGLANGAIDKALSCIDNMPEASLFYFNRYVCNSRLKPFIKENLIKIKDSVKISFNDKNQVIWFFNKLNSTTAALGYTNFIFKKQDWDRRGIMKDFLGTNYHHTAKLYQMLLEGNSVVCFKDYLILSRFGNDNFYSSFKQRVFLDYKAFYDISLMFSDIQIREAFCKIMIRHYNKVFLYVIALSSKISAEDYKLLNQIGYSAKELNIFNGNPKWKLYVGFGWNLLKCSLINIPWSIRMIFITIQKLKNIKGGK